MQTKADASEIETRLKAAIEKLAAEGRLTCEDAQRVADELGLPRMEVGRAADRLGIRIKGCQLGCF